MFMVGFTGVLGGGAGFTQARTGSKRMKCCLTLLLYRWYCLVNDDNDYDDDNDDNKSIALQLITCCIYCVSVVNCDDYINTKLTITNNMIINKVLTKSSPWIAARTIYLYTGKPSTQPYIKRATRKAREPQTIGYWSRVSEHVAQQTLVTRHRTTCCGLPRSIPVNFIVRDFRWLFRNLLAKCARNPNIYIYKTFIRHEDRIQHSTEIKQTDRQTDRQTDKQTNTTTDTSTWYKESRHGKFYYVMYRSLFLLQFFLAKMRTSLIGLAWQPVDFCSYPLTGNKAQRI